MGNAIAFYVISALILGFALLVVTTKNTVHAVLFLVLNFLAVAALYVLLTAQFLAAIQVLVYAGGIVVLYLFVVMLVNLKRPPEDHSAPQRAAVARVRACRPPCSRSWAPFSCGAASARRSIRTRCRTATWRSTTSSASACCSTPTT